MSPFSLLSQDLSSNWFSRQKPTNLSNLVIPVYVTFASSLMAQNPGYFLGNTAFYVGLNSFLQARKVHYLTTQHTLIYKHAGHKLQWRHFYW